MSIDELLFDAVLAAKEYEHIKALVSPPQQTAHRAALERAVRVLQGAAAATPPDVLALFKMHQALQLERLADALLPDLRSSYDTLFKNTLHWQRPRAVSHVTTMFDEFIKGITYFDDQPLGPRAPAYHRLFSCGTGRTAFRQSYLQCRDDGTMSGPDRRRTQEQIQTCYIERLVYDALFKHEHLHFPTHNQSVTPQDAGHEHFLTVTRGDFQSCFPHMDLRVHVDFDGNVPVRLEITRIVHGRRTSSSIYIKELHAGHGTYDPFVKCFLVKANGETTTRIQTFRRLPHPWRRVTPEAAGTMTPTPRAPDAPAWSPMPGGRVAEHRDSR